MKHFILLLMHMFTVVCAAEESPWQWSGCSSDDWLHCSAKEEHDAVIPCRGEDRQFLGVVDKETGHCVLLKSGERLDVYEFFNKTIPDYFDWIDHDHTSCVESLNPSTQPGMERELINCIFKGDRLCRFRHEQGWLTGLENYKRGERCVSEDGSGDQYELYAFNRKYKTSDNDATIVGGVLITAFFVISFLNCSSDNLKYQD